MNSVLKNVCKLKVPLKTHKPCAPCKTKQLSVVCPKPSSNYNSSRSYFIATNKEHVKNGLITLQTCPKFSCSYRRSFAQKTRHTGYGRTATHEEKDKKKDEVTEEQCISPKSDKKDKKASERSLKFTINLNEMIHSFNRKNNLVKSQGINKINTFYLKPGRCRCCTSRKKEQLDRFQQKRYISFSSKVGLQLPRPQANKIRKSLSYKHQTRGTMPYKIKETCRDRDQDKSFLKVPLFHILKDKVHSSSPVVHELSKRLRYHIDTKEALFGNPVDPSPTFGLDKQFTSTENSLALSCLKRRYEDKSCIPTSDVIRKISEQKLNINNLKKNQILQMLSDILIPLIERESIQYEEMRKAFVHLQKELELYFKDMKGSEFRSENEIFKIISNINQARKHQKELEASPLYRKGFNERNMSEKSDTIDNTNIYKDQYCLYGNCSGSTSNNKICEANRQLDEFPIAIMVKDNKQQVESQKMPYSHLGVGNASKTALTVRSSESEKKYTATRTYASDSKSTRGDSRDDFDKSFNSVVDHESDAGCFQYFQSKSIPPQFTQRPREQFTILESDYTRTQPVFKPRDPELPKKSKKNEKYTPAKITPTSPTIYDNKNVKPSSHSSFTSEPKKEVESKKTLQAPLSKAGLENLRRFERLEEQKQIEARLPFEDDVSKKRISIEPNKSKKEYFTYSNELPAQFPIKTAKKVHIEPRPCLKNNWQPKKITKSNSTPTLKTESTAYEQNVEKGTPPSILDNCRGIFENIFQKWKGPPKRNIGSYLSRKSHSTSTINSEDKTEKNEKHDDSDDKINKPEVNSKLRQKYPWNRLKMDEKILTRNNRSETESKRVYSTNTRKFAFSKKDYSSIQTTSTSLSTGKSYKNKYPWNFSEIQEEENTNCCYLTKTSYCDINKISSAEPEVPKVCDNMVNTTNKTNVPSLMNKNEPEPPKVLCATKQEPPKNICSKGNTTKEKVDKDNKEDCKNICEKKSQILDEANQKDSESKNKICKKKQVPSSAIYKKPSTEECNKTPETKVCKKELDAPKTKCEKEPKVVKNICQTKSEPVKKVTVNICKKKTKPPKKVCDKPSDSAKVQKSELSKCMDKKQSEDSGKIYRSSLQECKVKPSDKKNKIKKNCSKTPVSTNSTKADKSSTKKTKTKRKLCQSEGKNKKISGAAKKKTCAVVSKCNKKKKHPKKTNCRSEKPKKVESGTKCKESKKSICQDNKPEASTCKTSEVKDNKRKEPVCQDKQDNKPKEPICKLCPIPRQDNKPKESTCKVSTEEKDNKPKETTCKPTPPDCQDKQDKKFKEPICKLCPTARQDNKAKDSTCKPSQDKQDNKPKEPACKPSPAVCQDKQDKKFKEPICKLCPKTGGKLEAEKKCSTSQGVKQKEEKKPSSVCSKQTPSSSLLSAKTSSPSLLCTTSSTAKKQNELDIAQEKKCVNKQVKRSTSQNLLCTKPTEEDKNKCGTPKKIECEQKNTVSTSSVDAQKKPSECGNSVKKCLGANEILCDKKSSCFTPDPFEKATDLVTKATKKPIECNKKGKPTECNKEVKPTECSKNEKPKECYKIEKSTECNKKEEKICTKSNAPSAVTSKAKISGDYPGNKAAELVSKATRKPTECNKKEESICTKSDASAITSKTKISIDLDPESKAKFLVKKALSKPEVCDKKETSCEQPEVQKKEIKCEQRQINKAEKEGSKCTLSSQTSKPKDKRTVSKSEICDKKENQQKQLENLKDSNDCGKKLKNEFVKKESESKSCDKSACGDKKESEICAKKEKKSDKQVKPGESATCAQKQGNKSEKREGTCTLAAQSKKICEKQEAPKETPKCEKKQVDKCENKSSKSEEKPPSKCDQNQKNEPKCPALKESTKCDKTAKPTTCEEKIEKMKNICEKKESKKCTLAAPSKKICEKEEAPKKTAKCEEKQVVDKCENKSSKTKEKPPNKCDQNQKNEPKCPVEKSTKCDKTAKPTTCEEKIEKMENICEKKESKCSKQEIFAECMDEGVKKEDSCKPEKNKVDKCTKCEKKSKECTEKPEKKETQSRMPKKEESLCENKEKSKQKEDTCNKKEDKCANPEKKGKCEKLVEELISKNKKGTGEGGCPSTAAKPKPSCESPNKSATDKKKCSSAVVETQSFPLPQMTLANKWDLLNTQDKLKNNHHPAEITETQKPSTICEEIAQTLKGKSVAENILDKLKKGIITNKAKSNSSSLESKNQTNISEKSKIVQSEGSNGIEYIQKHPNMWYTKSNLGASKAKPLSYTLKNRSYIYEVLKVRQMKRSTGIKDFNKQANIWPGKTNLETKTVDSLLKILANKTQTNVSCSSNTEQIKSVEIEEADRLRNTERSQFPCNILENKSQTNINEASKIEQNKTSANEVDKLSKNTDTSETNLATMISNFTSFRKTKNLLKVNEHPQNNAAVSLDSQEQEKLSTICGDEIETSTTNLLERSKNIPNPTNTSTQLKAPSSEMLEGGEEKSFNNRDSESSIMEESTNALQTDTNIDENKNTPGFSDDDKECLQKYSNIKSGISSDLSKPRVFNLDNDGEVFICKVEKLTKDCSGKPIRTLKCKLVKDKFGRDTFLCKEVKDEDDGAKIGLEKKETLMSPKNESKSSTDVQCLSSKSPSSTYLEFYPVRITREVLQRDNEHMERLLERYKSFEAQNDETEQRIYRLYSLTRKLLNRYYLLDKENSKTYFDYKDIVLKQHLKQRNDNRDTLENYT